MGNDASPVVSNSGFDWRSMTKCFQSASFVGKLIKHHSKRMTAVQFLILDHIAQSGGTLKLRALRDQSYLGTSPTHNIQSLSKRGFVVQQQDQRDQRVKFLHITPEGTQFLAKAREQLGRYTYILPDIRINGDPASESGAGEKEAPPLRTEPQQQEAQPFDGKRLRDFFSEVVRLDKFINDKIPDEFDLSTQQLLVLCYVDGAEGPVNRQEIEDNAYAGVNSSYYKEKLLCRGLLQYADLGEGHDKRVKTLEITQKGRDAVREAMDALAQYDFSVGEAIVIKPNGQQLTAA